MDLRSARLTEQMNDSRTGRSAHYGIVYHYDSLAANALANGIKLDFNRALTLILRGLYETPSDVFVLYKAYSVGNPYVPRSLMTVSSDERTSSFVMMTSVWSLPM